ncbi:hypothetical protein WA026_022165 [Henosepilachna vigintioctopunctata]|uniref:Uncharacterized protein n=1 Tax=Henosepilachna vigintioctopunctata TaxID=420089 RepID=A0AAW1TXB3_9CUCU
MVTLMTVNLVDLQTEVDKHLPNRRAYRTMKGSKLTDVPKNAHRKQNMVQRKSRGEFNWSMRRTMKANVSEPWMKYGDEKSGKAAVVSLEGTSRSKSVEENDNQSANNLRNIY